MQQAVYKTKKCNTEVCKLNVVCLSVRACVCEEHTKDKMFTANIYHKNTIYIVFMYFFYFNKNVGKVTSLQ